MKLGMITDDRLNSRQKRRCAMLCCRDKKGMFGNVKWNELVYRRIGI